MRHIIYVLLFLPYIVFSQESDFSVLKGPYLGQKLSGVEPELFMPGLITTYDFEGCIAFLNEARACVFFNAKTGVRYTYEKDGKWTTPTVAPFQNDGFTDFTVAPDGNTLYFQSSRFTSPNDTIKDANIWFVEWTGSGWTKAEIVPKPANTDKYNEFYPSISKNGDLYFFSGWDNRSSLGDLYISSFVNGKYLTAEQFSYPINTKYHEVDPVVAPDGSFIVFGSSRPGGFSFWDLYVIFRNDDGSWSHPINAGSKINSLIVPVRMSITPDGKYFFFISNRMVNISKGEKIDFPLAQRYHDYDIYWMDTKFISELKKDIIKAKCAFKIVEQEYQINGLDSALKKLNYLYINQKDDYHFELSEFLSFCGNIMDSGNDNEAYQLYEALLILFPNTLRVKQGFAHVNIFHGNIEKGLSLLKEIWNTYPDSKREYSLDILQYDLSGTSQKESELELLEFIVNEFPDSYKACYNLARSYYKNKNTEQAIKYCEKSLKLKPDFGPSLGLLKKLESQM